MQTTKLYGLVMNASKRKGLSLRELTKRAEIKNHSQVSRALRGQASMKREMLTKICAALECSQQERADIFHAAGYLSPEEMDEEEESSHAAA